MKMTGATGRSCTRASILHVATVALLLTGADAFIATAPRGSTALSFQATAPLRKMSGIDDSADQDNIVRRMARSSFEAVPEPSNDVNKDSNKDEMDQKLSELTRQQQDKIAEDLLMKPKAGGDGTGLPVGKVAGFSQPTGESTATPANAKGGFGTQNININKPPPMKSYTAIGAPPVNDINKPEYDPDGYMLYTNEKTGEKARVFEALIEYPTDFKIKIVGKNEGSFVEDIVELVRVKCGAAVDGVPHSTKVNGKWVSVTVSAPVQNAEMLYELYETIDSDSRVRFKF